VPENRVRRLREVVDLARLRWNVLPGFLEKEVRQKCPTEATVGPADSLEAGRAGELQESLEVAPGFFFSLPEISGLLLQENG
jgi:hypothetical protein